MKSRCSLSGMAQPFWVLHSSSRPSLKPCGRGQRSATTRSVLTLWQKTRAHLKFVFDDLPLFVLQLQEKRVLLKQLWTPEPLTPENLERSDFCPELVPDALREPQSKKVLTFAPGWKTGMFLSDRCSVTLNQLGQKGAHQEGSEALKKKHLYLLL